MKYRIWNQTKKKFITDVDWRFLRTVGWYFDWVNGDIRQVLTIDPYKERIVGEVNINAYIGHRDKNGVDICESDIVKSTTFDETEIFPIIYFEEEVKFCGKMEGGIRSLYFDDAWEYEVIGNIYENPELLEPNRA